MDIFVQYNIEDIIRIGVAIVLLLSGVISMVFIIWGGFLMILSGGNEEKIKPAVNHMRHAIIGVVFILVAVFVLPKFLDIVGLPGSNYVTPSAIFQTIQEISGTIFKGGSMRSIGGSSSTGVQLDSDNFSNLDL